MTLFGFLLLVATGCGAGFMAGLFGVGGGFILVPILVLSYEVAGLPSAVLTHVAIGTSLFAIVFASAASAYQHGRQGNVDWGSVWILGLSSALTAFVATIFAAALSGRHLRMIFSVVLMAASIRMLTEGVEQAEKKLEQSSRPGAASLVGVGLATGLVSALAGIGGGVFIVPVMYHVLKMPLRLAIGTSSATVLITALCSAGGYVVNGMGHPGLPLWSLGFVDLRRGVVLGIGTLLLARVGAYASLRIHPYLLRKMFSLLLLLISVYLLVR